MKFEEVQKITESFDNLMFFDYGYMIDLEEKNDMFGRSLHFIYNNVAHSYYETPFDSECVIENEEFVNFLVEKIKKYGWYS